MSLVRPEAARSVAFQPLPPLPPPPSDPAKASALVLFYQYKEPHWTEKEHKEALKRVIAIGKEHGITGRGRCAREGLNCTLTGTPEGIRGFCNGLRAWKPELFNATDFKITDHFENRHVFKALTVRHTDELVAYGMADELAPTLTTSRARHVEADEYHELMTDKDAVIIDVRNAYESAIGHFQPPPDGATLIDPKMRNSYEFPKWLNAPETREQLHGKKVLMYCTGGIRCERASALMDTLARTSDGAFEPADVVMVRGGIERYMKTFPEGGFWKGKNYLFDHRQEQRPEAKSDEALARDIESHCASCHAPCATYRGTFKCAGVLPPPVGNCGVPVIVCARCARSSSLDASRSLYCPLCEEGYVPPSAKPDILLAKRKLADRGEGPAEANVGSGGGGEVGGGGGGVSIAAAGRDGATSAKRARWEARAACALPSSRLFVGNLPFATSARELRATLQAAIDRSTLGADGGEGGGGGVSFGGEGWAIPSVDAAGSSGGGGGGFGQQQPGAPSVLSIDWLTDRQTGLFYGSAFVRMSSTATAQAVVACASRRGGPSVYTKAQARRVFSKRAVKAAKNTLAEAKSKEELAMGKSLATEVEAAKEVKAAAKAYERAKGGEPGLRLGGRRLRVSFAPLSSSDAEGKQVPPAAAAGQERERPPVSVFSRA